MKRAATRSGCIGTSPTATAESQALKARPPLAAGTRLTEVLIEHLHALRRPTELHGTLHERALTALALQVMQHLMEAGLPDVDVGKARVMGAGELVRRHRRAPSLEAVAPCASSPAPSRPEPQ